jgi:hypothetical protein
MIRPSDIAPWSKSGFQFPLEQEILNTLITRTEPEVESKDWGDPRESAMIRS